MGFEAELCKLRKDVHTFSPVLGVIYRLTLGRLLRYTTSLVEVVK
jgi:hypothetical protein